MRDVDPTQALLTFQDYVTDLAKTRYGWDEARAFRHAAFRLLAPGPSLSDEQIAEVTAIAAIRDLDVGGWALDLANRAVFLMQSVGYNTKTDVERVEQFWNAPERALASLRQAPPEPAVQELARVLQERLRNGDSLRMAFVSRGGFTSAASEFATARSNAEKVLFMPSGGQVSCLASLELIDEFQLALSYRERADP